MHDWTRVDAGILHAYRHSWVEEIVRALNREILPDTCYALAHDDSDGTEEDHSPSGSGVLLTVPKLQPTAETDMAFYRRKQSTIAIRHVSGDRIVAMIEIVPPGNKASRHALRSFGEKVAQLLDRRIHLLILDPHPPGRRDPHGIHGEIGEEIAGQEYTAPTDRPMTLAAYEYGLSIRAYTVHLRSGDTLPDMPVFLEPEKAVLVPLEATYQAAFAAVPRRWQRVLNKCIHHLSCIC